MDEDENIGGLRGYVHGEVYENLYTAPMFNVLALAVAKKYRQQGVGGNLLANLEHEGKRRGYQGVRLNSGEERKAAHDFYQHLGYSNDKKQKRFVKKF